MPKSEKEKELILAKIQSDLLLQADRVSKGMKYISDHDLSATIKLSGDNIVKDNSNTLNSDTYTDTISPTYNTEIREVSAAEIFAIRLKKSRKNAQYTQEIVAEKLGIEHSVVSDKENVKKAQRATVDRIYLQIFSIFYKVSPLYLIGKVNYPDTYNLDENMDNPKDENLISPVKAMNKTASSLSLYIISSLYHQEADGILLLKDFIKLSDCSAQRLAEVYTTLQSLPRLSKAKTPALNNDHHVDEFFRIWTENRNKPEIIELLNKTEDALLYIYEHNFKLFDILMKIVSMPGLTTVIHDLLNDGGFFK